jgi:hypothetical protein
MGMGFWMSMNMNLTLCLVSIRMQQLANDVYCIVHYALKGEDRRQSTTLLVKVSSGSGVERILYLLAFC